MGIELDVLVGHPEHELLFVATQVAKAAGLKDGKGSARNFIRTGKLNGSVVGVQIFDLIGKGDSNSTLTGEQCAQALRYPRWRDTWMMDEGTVYTMLLRGHAPQSEPFRKWVTEEVLPTIRKTGKYDAEQSTNPIAVGIMDELKLLRGELVELKEIVKALSLPTVTVVKAPDSPYEGVTKGTVWYYKDKAAIRKAGETLRLSVPVFTGLEDWCR